MLFWISSISLTDGESFKVCFNSFKSKSFSNSTFIDSLCELNTGTLTVVAVTFKSGFFNIQLFKD